METESRGPRHDSGGSGAFPNGNARHGDERANRSQADVHAPKLSGLRSDGASNTSEPYDTEQVSAVTEQLARVQVRESSSRRYYERKERGMLLQGKSSRKTGALQRPTPERATLERLRRKRVEVLARGAALRSALTFTDSWNVSAEHLKRQVRRFHELVAESSYPDWVAEYERRSRLARHLRNVASSRFRGCRVDVYGSTATGVLLKGGDLDVNFVAPMAPLEVLRAQYQDEEYSIDDFRRDVVGDLGRLLRRRRHEFVNVQIITQTRVPLVKFHDLRSDIEVDVQVNNDFVVRNTALLRAYVRLDPRVRPLAIFIKRWAVARDLNEPFAGTLSSYAYLMLLIQYLQIVNPPVLPCLQALRLERIPVSNGGSVQHIEKLVEHPQEPEVPDETLVDDYFLDRTDIQMPVCNEMSVTLLLAGFFYFYGYQFNYDEMVVSVRCGRLISKKRRGWDQSDRVQTDQNKADDVVDGIGDPYTHASDDETDHEDVAEELTVDDAEVGTCNGSERRQRRVASMSATESGTDSSHSGADEERTSPEQPLNHQTVERAVDLQSASVDPSGDHANAPLQELTAPRPRAAVTSQAQRERLRLQRQRRQRERATHATQRHFFCIEDPFDMTHDLGRVCSEDSVRLLRHEFRRAFAIIAQQLPLDSLLQSYVPSETPAEEP
ncbi:hypothetical protein, conserved [Cyanidioschyzon merolae strain 10D]|uniref:Uncharacterized protein n=1 Tax=Cyanidioschyzon merolae (strain NIES-3377 / 10D) TaxID=280699 RepID=M1V7X9_CYAM1|nr:hypothetical protein, conserved [Cyanidioschyzon merolae strain 10D]BAM83490.1 hypothetical protein, conserved [Cyanidioschyzon merolae strain 10D]|eukprot:XP_005539526.1 hypothetical protein, conserved [Cyanidioschyzon merolae strain 10D]